MVETDRWALTLLAAIVVGREIALWRQAGRKPRLWWRDDDAREPTPNLDRLLEVAGSRPLGLAVVPDGDLVALAARLRQAPGVCVGQHGVDHQNRRTGGAPPSEYPDPPTVDQLEAAIERGRSRLEAVGLSPAFYTPPWNHAEPGLGEALAGCGFTVLSASRERPPTPEGLDYIPAELDLLRWKGGPRFKGARRALVELAEAMRARREAGDFDRPIGLLTHHLAHDEATWRYLVWLLVWLDSRVHWLDPRIEGAGAGGAMARRGAVC